jgi:hypothetical protein
MLTAEEVKSDKKARAELVERVRAGAQFNCFSSAKVQILTQNLAETALVCGALLRSKLSLSMRIGLTKPAGKRRDGARVRSPHDGGHC